MKTNLMRWQCSKLNSGSGIWFYGLIFGRFFFSIWILYNKPPYIYLSFRIYD